MLSLTGTVINVYESPKGVMKETGEIYGGQSRIQLMCENVLKNGQKRMDLVDLSVGDVSAYRDALGKPVSVPVGVYVSNGKPAFYAIKGEGQQ